MTTTRAFDQVRVGVPAAYLDAPTSAGTAAWLRDLARRHLDGDPGFFVLTGLDGLGEAAMGEFALAASSALGELVPQDSSGTLLREVRYRGVKLGEGRTGRYSDSRDGGNLHTDSPHRPHAVPDCFALACVHQAAIGGDLVVVRLDDVVERLGATPEVLATLRRPVHFDTRDDDPAVPRTVERPVLEERDGRDHVRYLREYIDIGHRQPGIAPLTPEQIHAFDALDAAIESPDLQHVDRLEPGEMIFVDNRWTLHGRVAFDDQAGDDRRLMLRTWITRGVH